MGDREETQRATDALMAVSRTMTAIVARTLTNVSDDITVPQLRVLVLLFSRGPMNLRTIAEHLDVNASNASRTCEQLVASSKVRREEDEDDRRTVRLSLTSQGRTFVEQLMDQRRQMLGRIVARMDAPERSVLADALESFAAAVASAPPDEVVGLPDGRIIPWLM